MATKVLKTVSGTACKAPRATLKCAINHLESIIEQQKRVKFDSPIVIYAQALLHYHLYCL